LFRGTTEVAVKQLHTSDEDMSSDAKSEFMREAKILRSLHHPNLVITTAGHLPA
jgi:serine/threonine protein kinase